MKINIYNIEKLDSDGSQMKLVISILTDEEPVLLLTKNKADSIGDDVINKIQAINSTGFYILKIVRIVQGVTQSDMANLLNISKATYLRRENRNNGSEFRLNDVVAICKKLKMSSDLLFYQSKHIKIA